MCNRRRESSFIHKKESAAINYVWLRSNLFFLFFHLLHVQIDLSFFFWIPLYISSFQHLFGYILFCPFSPLLFNYKTASVDMERNKPAAVRHGKVARRATTGNKSSTTDFSWRVGGGSRQIYFYMTGLQWRTTAMMAMSMAGPSLLYDGGCLPGPFPHSERGRPPCGRSGSVSGARSRLQLLAGQRDDVHSDVVARAQFVAG